MGLFSKIGEMIRRIRTQKLYEGKDYNQNQYQDTKSINYTNEETFINKIQREQEKYEQIQNGIRSERMKNPYLEKVGKEYTGKDGKIYCNYDGVNVSNGDILRVRKLNKFKKDKRGTYIYTGYIETVTNEDNVDVMLLSNGELTSGIPICFTTDRKIEEIMQLGDQRDLKALLSLLSEDVTNNNGYLNYIGKIDKYNGIERDLEKTSITIQKAVEELKQNFYEQKVQEQQIEQSENREKY